MLLFFFFLALIIFFWYSAKSYLPRCPVCGTVHHLKDIPCPFCGYDAQPFNSYQIFFPVVNNGVYYMVTSDRFARLVFKDSTQTFNFVVYLPKVTPNDIVYLRLASKSTFGSSAWFDFDFYVNGEKIDTFSKNVNSTTANWVSVGRLVCDDFTPTISSLLI